MDNELPHPNTLKEYKRLLIPDWTEEGTILQESGIVRSTSRLGKLMTQGILRVTEVREDSFVWLSLDWEKFKATGLKSIYDLLTEVAQNQENDENQRTEAVELLSKIERSADRRSATLTPCIAKGEYAFKLARNPYYLTQGYSEEFEWQRDEEIELDELYRTYRELEGHNVQYDDESQRTKAADSISSDQNPFFKSRPRVATFDRFEYDYLYDNSNPRKIIALTTSPAVDPFRTVDKMLKLAALFKVTK